MCYSLQPEQKTGVRPVCPLVSDVVQKMDAADKGLIPTERFAQQEEKIINGELQADKKKQ